LLGFAIAYTAHAQNSGNATAGGRTFSANCAACHGGDGRGGERAPNIVTARDVVSLSDADLSRMVRNGVTGAGMPPFAYLGDSGIADVVAYLRTLQGKTGEVKVNGDSEAGRALFFGKAECSKCHMMQGEGGFIAPDLSSYGSARNPDRIRAAIVDPDTALGVTAEVIEVRTAGGANVRGVVRAEDNFTLVIQQEDGRFRRFAKSEAKDIHRTGHSLMPRDYRERLSAKELDDMVSYLVRSASPMEPGSTKRNAKQ
jgi:putative heme-binding domain-containing protein